MWMPVHISDHYFDQNRNYCGLYVVSKIELPDFGPTSELVKIFDKRGIILITISSHQKDNIAYDFVIVDLTGKKHLKEDIRKEILDKFGKRLLLFECVETGVPGFIYNVKGFPLVFNFSDDYIPMAALSINSWRNLLEGLVDRYGAGGLVIIWHMGNDAGEEKARQIMRLKGDLSCTDRIKIALARLQSFGWGRFEIRECDEDGKRIVIRVYDNFEDLVTKDLKDYQNNFLEGYLVGLISILFGKACRGVEQKCIKKGHKYCEFLIR